MVAFEYLAEIAPQLARKAIDEMWERFPLAEDAVKGDIIHLFGVLNNKELIGRLESVINGNYAEAVRETAKEVIEDME
jgi:glutamine synthetase type III